MNTICKDTETGGLYASIHALLSIGAVCSWETEAPNFHVYVTAESQPGKCVEPEAAEKNGYSPERWADNGAVDLATAMTKLMEWVTARKNERPDAVFVCHHLAFDKPFLAEAARIVGLGDLPHRNDWRCSQVLFGELMDRGLIERGSSSLNRLKELCGWVGLRSEKHNALEDAAITMAGHRWLVKKASEADEERKALSELAGSRLAKIRELETALFGKFPRNPERDADGNAVLYPGALLYEGVAAVFGGAELGEWVVLAPTAEALEARIRLHDIADELQRDRCRIARLEPMKLEKGKAA